MQALAAVGPAMQLGGSIMGTISNVMATDVQAKGLGNLFSAAVPSKRII